MLENKLKKLEDILTEIVEDDIIEESCQSWQPDYFDDENEESIKGYKECPKKNCVIYPVCREIDKVKMWLMLRKIDFSK